MNHLKIILAAALCVLGGTALAQDTNLLRTQIGSLESRTGEVIVKGSAQVGAIALDSAQLVVRYKQTEDVGTGDKAYGLAVEVEANSMRDRLLVDDEELDPLLNAVVFLSKISPEVSPLPGFEASFTTKSGLRVMADSVRRDGGVLTYIQFCDGPHIPLSSVQMTQFASLLQQCRKNLDALKSAK